MKKMLCLLLVLSMLTGLCGMALAASGTVRTTGNVWLRKGPGLGYSKITALEEGTKLEYMGKTSTDDRGVKWYYVKYHGQKCWISSRYSKLSKSSSDATKKPEPTSTPAPTDTPKPTELPALTESPADIALPALADQTAPLPTAMPAQAVPEAVELSPWYLANLEEAAAALSLGNFKEDADSDTPLMYFNEVLLISGRKTVEHFRVTGEGYSIFGVSVGMDMDSAAAAMTAAGLARADNILGASFRHYAGPDAPANVMGFDSFINIVADAENKVAELSWSVYTV